MCLRWNQPFRAGHGISRANFVIIASAGVMSWCLFYKHIFVGIRAWIRKCCQHYSDVIMWTIKFQITSLTIVYSTVYSDADQRKHQSSASLAFARGIHRGPVNSPHKWPVTRKMFPFDDVIMMKNFGMQLPVHAELNKNAVEVNVWVSNYMLMSFQEVITHPCVISMLIT